MLQPLTTTDEIIDKLDGNPGVAALTGRDAGAVSNWRSREKFPPDTILVITEALKAKGFTAPPSLWGVMEPSPDLRASA